MEEEYNEETFWGQPVLVPIGYTCYVCNPAPEKEKENYQELDIPF